MDFLVLGRDREGFAGELTGAEDARLNEAHWGYLDGYADRLIARGPILSPDGETHRGSVHVVSLESRAAADAFAFAEPYWLAGMYETVDVVGFENILGVTMWQRRPGPSPCSWLLSLSWEAGGVSTDALATGRAEEILQETPETIFAGFLVGGSARTGLVAAVDGSPHRADEIAGTLTQHLQLPRRSALIERWCRGGRPSDR